MIIGERLRALREKRELTQGDIQKRTGLVRPYISRVEHGHLVPSVETLEKFARALEIPLYRLLYDGDERAKLPGLPKWLTGPDGGWGSSGKDRRFLKKLRKSLANMEEPERHLLLKVAQKMAGGRSRSVQPGKRRRT